MQANTADGFTSAQQLRGRSREAIWRSAVSDPYTRSSADARPSEPSLSPLSFDPRFYRPRDGRSSHKGALANTSSPVAVINRVGTLRRLCTVLACRPVS